MTFLTDPFAQHPVVNPRTVCHGGGGGIGGGVGGLLGTIAGIALAPETGGLSLLIPAGMGLLGGVGGNLLGDAITGSPVDPMGLAMSGIGGGIGGGLAGAGGLGSMLGGLGGASAASAAAPFGSAIGEGVGGAMAGEMFGQLPSVAASAAPSVMAPALTAGAGTLEATAPLAASGAGAFAEPAVAAAGPGSVVAAGGFPADVGTQLSTAGLPGSTSAIDYSITGGAAGPLGGAANSGMLSGITDFLGRNANWIMPGMMALNMGRQMAFPSATPGAGDLSYTGGIARNIAGMYGSGGLTPQQQAAYDQMVQGQVAAIKAKFASLGLSGSDAELQEIQHAQTAAFGATAKTMMDNSNTALTAVGVANQPTIALAQQQLQDDAQLSQALAELAAAGIFMNTSETKASA